MKRLAWLVSISLCLTSGCATRRSQTKEALRVSRIAVLPPQSSSKDPHAPMVVRQLVQRWLVSRGYTTVPQAVVDQELTILGASKSEMLDQNQMERLSLQTGADTMAVIDVLDFSSSNRGFSSERRVALAIRLVEARNGQVLWQGSDQKIQASKTRNPVTAVYNYVRGEAGTLFEEAIRSPLYPETTEVVSRILSKLPAYAPPGS